MGNPKLLCYGDSNTYGFDPRSFFGGRYEKKERWTGILAEKTGLQVQNLGENGRTIPNTPAELARLDRLLAQWEPEDLLLVMLGTNDLLEGASAEEATDRMALLLRHLRQRSPGGQVLLLSPPPMTPAAFQASAGELERRLEALAEAWQTAFCPTGACRPELAFDGVHLSPRGHGQLAAFLLTQPEISRKKSLAKQNGL